MTNIIPIRGDNGYIGASKQLLQGTPVAPTYFPRILDGSSFMVELAAGELWEMDGSRHVSQLIKNRQSVKIKQVVTPRMNEAAMLEEATMGIGSDVITAGTPAGTLNTALTANTSTTISLTGAGFSVFLTPASSTLYLLIVDPVAGNEIIPCTLPATGTNPYTFTIAATYNSGHPKLSHAGGNALSAAVATIVNTAFTSNAVAGATTIVLGNNNGLTTASSTYTLALSVGTAREEIVTVTTPATSGTGPWTFTLANGAVLKNAHTIGDLVYSAVVHTMQDQSDGDYYTLEVGLGSLAGAAGMTIRVRDCKVSTCKVSGKAGSELQYEVEWIGIACAVQGSPATLTFESHPVFLYTQGFWTIDGSSSSNDAISIESFSIERKNNPDLVQTESLIGAAIIFGNMSVDVAFETVYTAGSRFFLTYFGGPTGTADSQVIGAGSFLVTFTQPDNLQAITYSVPVQHYSKVSGVDPKKDGKHYKQAVSAVGVSNAGAALFIMQTTINNTQLAQY